MSIKCRHDCNCRKHSSRGKPRWWTQEEIAFIKAHYDGSLKSRDELSKMFNVGRTAIWHVLHRSGLLMKGWKSRWTEKEVELLLELVPKLRLGEIAERLNKSINAITAKMYHLREQGIHISTKYREEWYTAGEIAMILGVDPQRVTGYIHSGRLAAEPNNPNCHPGKGKFTPWRISQKSFRNFLTTYPYDITVRKNVDFPVLIDVLTSR